MEAKITEQEFYNYIITHPEVVNDMEKLVQIRRLVIKRDNNLNSGNSRSNERGKYKVKTSNNLIFKPSDREAGFSNVLMLGILSFVSEIMFIMISYLLFK